jgi:hypothetical protein
VGSSEPAAINAPVEDEVVQAILGMNQKPILFPCPGIFQPPSLPPKFSPPTSPTSYLPTLLSYLPHLISHSLHLKSLVELLRSSRTELHDTRLEEGGELNIGRTWKA